MGGDNRVAINFVTVKCPECGASINIEENRTNAFCSYCGAKIIITNENEYVYRHIDEAGIKKAETDRVVKLKQLEVSEKKARIKLMRIRLALILAAVGVVVMIAGALLEHATDDDVFGTMMLLGLLPIVGSLYILLD